MNGLSAFLHKELTEIHRTWRIWVIPGMLIFFGVTSPIIALLTPALVSSIAGSQPGVVIQLPPATVADSYGAFLKNLTQLVLIAVVLGGAGVISGERSSGTAILALTKPISRSAFVLAKIISQTSLLVAFTIVGTAACLAMTALLFEGSGVAPLVVGVAVWLTYACLLVVVTTLFSATFRSPGAAAGAGLGFYFLTVIVASWPAAAKYSFLGLVPAMTDAVAGEPLAVGWPVGSAIVTLIVCAVLGVRVFRRQEL